MKVGLIDIDGTDFPTLTLMKLSAWHKAKGDTVELLKPADVLGGVLFGGWDKLYASCIFDKNRHIAEAIARETGAEIGGSAWDMAKKLPYEIEHARPDYSLYGVSDTAYGFLTRGCPRQCPFCIVAGKEGAKSVKVADLHEWWRGQKFIKLLDPNILASEDSFDLLNQLAVSGAWVDFTQGVDARLLNDENLGLLSKIKTKMIHFAWDNPKDKSVPTALLKYREAKGGRLDHRKNAVYVLTNYWSSFEQDLERVYWLREHDFDPYVMIYDKEHAPQNIRMLQRWVNNKIVFWTVNRFEDYDRKKG